MEPDRQRHHSRRLIGHRFDDRDVGTLMPQRHAGPSESRVPFSFEEFSLRIDGGWKAGFVALFTTDGRRSSSVRHSRTYSLNGQSDQRERPGAGSGTMSNDNPRHRVLRILTNSATDTFHVIKLSTCEAWWSDDGVCGVVYDGRVSFVECPARPDLQSQRTKRPTEASRRGKRNNVQRQSTPSGQGRSPC